MVSKRSRAKVDFEKDFYKLRINAAMGKMFEDVRYRSRLEIFEKDDFKNIKKQQFNLTFNGIHKSYEICNG